LVWDDFCSTYIELAKVKLQQGSAAQKAAILHFLDILLRALHPMIPFVTEEIHDAVLAGRLLPGEPELLTRRSWPVGHPVLARSGGDPGLIPVFQEALSSFLRLRAEHGLDASKRVRALCTLVELAPFEEALMSLAKLESVTFAEGDLAGPSRAVAVLGAGMLALELAGLKDPVAERAKLERELDKLRKELEPLQARLADAGFLAKAPEAAVAKLRGQVEEKETRLAKISSLLG
jgi:valyl-tRNA synthetase